MPILTAVTTIEIPTDTPILRELLLTKEIPMLIPRDIPIRITVRLHIKNLRSLLLSKANPTHSHFIYSGCGAFLTLTPFIGKSLFLHKFQKLPIDAG